MGSICIVGGGLSIGGQERGMTNLANFLADQGHQVRIICLFHSEVQFELRDSISISWPEIKRTETNKLIYALRLIPYVRKSIRTFNAQVVLSFGDWFNGYTLLATRGLKIPVYIANRMGPAMNHGRFFKAMNSLSYPWATAMIVQTKRAQEIMHERYGVTNFHVIPNPVPAIQESKVKPEKRVLSLGRLSKEKGHEMLIRAFAKSNHGDWELHLAGDGPLRSFLENLVKDLNMETRIKFHGNIQKIGDFLSSGEIFVLPSIYEGFPNALLEAMAYGLAPVSSNCIAGPAELIDDGNNGYLFEPGEIDGLTNCLDKLFSQPEQIETFAKKALNVREEFAREKLLQQFEKVLFPSISGKNES